LWHCGLLVKKKKGWRQKNEKIKALWGHTKVGTAIRWWALTQGIEEKRKNKRRKEQF